MTTNRLIAGDTFEGLMANRNYVAGSSFELGLTPGWVTYADAAATTPVDGIGGSPNVTFTAQSGSLVRGLFSGRLTKDAVNRQGQGASFDFTIPAADTGRPVSIAFDFLASAAYVANDVGVYIYDVTNATLITPAAINVAAGKGTFKSFFVASTSTSYRLILHVASTNASAWTLDTDNFQVGQQPILSGAAVTDWQAYTPSSTQGFGTISSPNVWYRRVGDSIEISARFTTGTVAGSEARWELPTGLTIGTFSTAQSVGRWTRNVAGTAVKQGIVTAVSGVSYLTFGLDDTATAQSPFTNQNGNALFGSTESGAFFARLPIANWSSNTTMAERAVEEYAFNTGAVTAAGGSDTSSFGNGAVGTLINSFNSATYTGNSSTSLTCRFQTPIQSTDNIRLEFLPSGSSTWVPASERLPHMDFAAATYGAFVSPSSSTDVIVQFGNAGAFPNASPGSGTGAAWSAVNTWRWRVRKVSGGAVVGYPVGARNVVGDTTGTAVPSGYIGEVVEVAKTTATTGSATLSTLTDVGHSTFTLTPGSWELEGICSIGVDGATGSGATGVNMRLEITDNSNVVQRAVVGGQANASLSSCVVALYTKVRVNISASTTYKLRFCASVYSGTPTIGACFTSASASAPTVIRAVRVA